MSTAYCAVRTAAESYPAPNNPCTLTTAKKAVSQAPISQLHSVRKSLKSFVSRMRSLSSPAAATPAAHAHRASPLPPAAVPIAPPASAAMGESRAAVAPPPAALKSAISNGETA